MLSYRHGFHAGNWADVHKHAALVLLLEHLRAKAKPFSVIDAFAGDGLYDLDSAEAGKTGEFAAGIGQVWRRDDAPAGVAGYLALVRAANPDGRLRRYPGSPEIIRARLRAEDRLVLAELHPAGHAALRRWAGRDGRIAIHRRDGFELLGAAVPPVPRRGLALIDPSYEVKGDYEVAPRALAAALGRWRTGIFALWYPILPEGRHRALRAALDGLEAPVLTSELAPGAPPVRGLQGSGLAIVNPPYRLADRLAEAGEWLAGALFPAAPGRHALAGG